MPGTNEYLSGNFGETFSARNVPTQVNVAGFSGNALDGIINAISKQSRSIDNLLDSFNESEDNNRRNNQSQLVRSVNSERRQRAANAALNGKIDKQLSALNVLTNTIKDAFNSIKDVIKEGFSKSLRSYDDMAKELRRQNLSTEIKKYAQTLADRANVGTYKVARESATAVTNFLAQNDTALLKRFNDPNATEAQKKLHGEIINLGAVFKEGGMDESMVAKLLGQINADNIDEWRKVALQSRASGSEGAAARQIITQMFNTPGGIASLGKDVAGGLNSVMQSARTAMSTGAVSEKLATELIEVSNKIRSGDIYDVDQNALSKALAVSGNNLNNPQALIESLNSRLLSIQSATGENRDKLYYELISEIKPLSNIMPDFVTEMTVSANRARAGNLNETGPETLEQIQKNLEDNRLNGKVDDWIGNLTSKFNLFTEDVFGIKGGVLGGLATELDELFGGAIGVEDVVKRGFGATVDLLKSISSKLTMQSISNLLSSSGILGSFFGALATKFPFLARLGMGAGAATTATATATTAATAAGTASRLGTFLKGAKVAGVVGAGITIAVAGKEIYDAFTEDQTSYITDKSSPAYKNIEKSLNQRATAAKAVGATIKAGLSIGAGMAGAKIGATIGAAAGPIGALIGAGIGVAAGAAIGPIISGAADVEMDKLNASLADTQAKQQQISDILQNGGLTPEAQKHYQEVLNQLKAIEKNTKEAMVNDVASNFEEQNDDLVKNNTGSTVEQLYSHIDKLKAEVAESEKRIAENPSAAGYEKDRIAELKKSIQDTRTAIQYTLGEETGMKAGQSVEDYISEQREGLIFGDSLTWGKYARQADNVHVDSSGRRHVNADEYKYNLWNKLLDKASNGLMGNDTVNKLSEINDVETFKSAFMEILNDLGLSSDKEFANFAWEKMLKETGKGNIDEFKKVKFLASGGIVNRATPAIVGEAGKEAVIPLTNQSAMTNVIKSLTADEKFSLIRSLLSAGGNLTKLDFIKILYSTIFGNSQSSSQATSVGSLVQNNLTRAIIEGAAAQKGHSYTEMMCNQLVEAALKYAGFTPPTTGIVTRHFNNPKMRLVLNDPVNGISPNDPALLPGMILFSHPFTQAEADMLNRTKGGNRKAGDPGHMGIYAGDGLWWNSTSAKSFVDYSSGSGIKSTAAGVALTKPYRRGTYKLYAAGYYEGMFSNDAVSGLPRASAGEGFGSTSGLLSQEDIMSLESAAGSNSSIMKQYIDQANKLVSGDNKGDIIAILMEIARYLKGIASAPSNKSNAIPVGRPLTPVYR